METLALLHSMPMLFMISTLLAMISLGWVRSDGFGPPEVGQVSDHRNKLLIRHSKGCEWWQLRVTLLSLPAARQPWLVPRFGTSFRVISG